MRIALAVIACAAFVAVPGWAQDTNTENAAAPTAAVTTDNSMTNVDQQAVPVTTAEPAAQPATPPRRRQPDKGFPWGVIGLVGLLGLLGRRRS